MKSVLDRHPGRSQRSAQVCLHPGQSRQIGAGDAGPHHAGAPDIRKRADPLRGEAKALVSPDDRGQRARQLLDMGAQNMTKEMERPVDPFDGIDSNDLAEWLERSEPTRESVAD